MSAFIGLFGGLLVLAGGGLFGLAMLVDHTGNERLDRRIAALLLAGLLAIMLGVIVLALAGGFPESLGSTVWVAAGGGRRGGIDP